MSQRKKAINPLPLPAKSSKKKLKKKQQESEDFMVDDSQISEQVPMRKKRLVNSKKKQDQKFILEPEYSEQEDDESYVSEDEKLSESSFEKYDEVDESLQKQTARQGKKQKGKAQRKSILPNKQTNKRSKKQEKSNTITASSSKGNSKPTVQTNLFQMFKMMKRNEPNVKMQDQKLSDDSMEQIKKRGQRREMGNTNANAGLSEKEAIKLAMQQSLEQQKLRKKEEKASYVPLDNYQYEHQSKSKKENIREQQTMKDEKKEKKQLSKRQKPEAKKNVSSKKQKPIGPMSGLHLIFTGEFESYSKNQIIQLVRELGAETHSSVVKKTTHLLQGSYCVNNFGKRTDQDVRTTNKSTQASQKGVKIIQYDDLQNFFLETTSKTLTQWMEKDKPKQASIDRFASLPKTDPAHISQGGIDEEYVANGKGDRIVPDGMSIPWTQRYKPLCSDEVLGQDSQKRQLKSWLEDWEDVHIHGNKKDVKSSFNPMIPAGNINSNAALLSGDAGLGKTTTARLIAAEHGYSIVEYNASDARNKKSVEVIGVGKDNMCLMGKRSEKSLIIMDEVDGMSNGDRGGITAIIDMIKKTKVPIICICNDRQSQKIRSLAGHCYDIKFHKPNKKSIVHRLEAIIQAEGGQASSRALQIIVDLLQNDVRQILQYLQLIFKTGTTNITADTIEKQCGQTKDASLLLNFFEGAKKLMCRTVFKSMNISQRVETVFIDSDFVPLLVQENYLSASKKKMDKQQFRQICKAAESFVKADNYDRIIMKNQDYSIMPNKLFMAAVYPSEMACQNIGFPKFTQWLGKFSSERKNKRLVRELKNTLACVSTVTSTSVKHVFAPMLYEKICRELKAHDPNIEGIVEFMFHYGITPLILAQNLVTLQYGERTNLFKNIEGHKKAKLTKAYNKMYEATKFKKQKIKASPVEHIKYDEILGELKEDNVEENSEEEEEGGENKMGVISTKKAKGAKNK